MTSKKTLGRYGPARGGVRVYEDHDRQLVTVFWRAHGRRRKASYELTREGRKEARTFAKALAKERATLKSGGRAPLSTRAVWKLFIDNQRHLRPRSVALYMERWGKWELYAGSDFIAEQADGLTMAGFVSALREIGHAVNQIAEHVKTVKIVYRWARSVKAIAHNDIADYSFKVGKDEQANEPPEYRDWEHEAILAELPPSSSRTWRAHAVLQFIGAQGTRINAALKLRWVDIIGARVCWNRATDKTGREWLQPLRIAAWGALTTAWYWRQCDGYTGDYVFYSARRDGHYGVQGCWAALRGAEGRAEVAHRDWRAFHGLRRMNTQDILNEFGGDLKLAMDFTGHKDLRSFQKYLKQRTDRLDAAVAELEARERSGDAITETGTQVAPDVPGATWDDRKSFGDADFVGATGRGRTDDRSITNRELYH